MRVRVQVDPLWSGEQCVQPASAAALQQWAAAAAYLPAPPAPAATASASASASASAPAVGALSVSSREYSAYAASSFERLRPFAAAPAPQPSALSVSLASPLSYAPLNTPALAFGRPLTPQAQTLTVQPAAGVSSGDSSASASAAPNAHVAAQHVHAASSVAGAGGRAAHETGGRGQASTASAAVQARGVSGEAAGTLQRPTAAAGGELELMDEETGARMFVCAECGQRFKQRIHLQKHSSKHTGNRIE